MSKKLLLVAAAVVILIGVGGFILFHGKKSPDPDPPPVKIDLGDMTVRLREDKATAPSGACAEHYLQVRPVIEVTKKQQAQFEKEIALARDLFIEVAINCTADELMDSKGIQEMKKAYRKTLEQRFGSGTVTAVFFSGFLVE